MPKIQGFVRHSLLILMLSFMALPASAETPWPEEGWRVMPTQHSYSDLLDQLKQAVKDNGMGVVFDVGPTEVAAERGVEIPGNRVVGVFRNDIAVEMLRLSVPAMIEAPLRFYVTENEDGTATLAWQLPSEVFAPYAADLDDSSQADALNELADQLEERLAEIAEQATASSR
ncbi:DUF302 domain-containing protein [Halomonas sabkhae]|uniref:DUF302 domain-containing protein n=1 Tax=Halomonas sabkhae TaxID=626223 RepID=UPI0025B42DD2|nr:DUF302 domain-containing protein [Halomonas sabkhae]MDN3524908.1 DUF302 domain-containing protein [Halomonas sabkhae]